MKKSIKIMLGLMAFLFTGCDANSPLSLIFNPPQCSINNIVEEDYRPGHFARYIIIASNDHEAIAFDVGCTIKLKRGRLIIERSTAYFGTLEQGESAQSEAWFSNIKTHDEYSYAEIVLYWYDANGDYYEKYY